MSKTLRVALASSIVSLLVAAGCSGESENQGLSDPGPSAGGGGSQSGPPVVVADGGEADMTIDPPPVVEPDPEALDCSALEELGDCGGESVEAEIEPANILLVIDKSGSMDDTPEGFDVNKWTALYDALGEALNADTTNVNFGLLLYPDRAIDLSCTSGCCEVPAGADAVNVAVAPSSSSVRDIMLTLEDTEPGGGTPTAAALTQALEYFTSGAGADLDGDRYVLLATDGGPNCNAELGSCEAATCTSNMDGQCMIDNCCKAEIPNAGELCLDDAAVLAAIAALKEAGIATFVVGIPGTEAYASYLDTFAEAGGVPDPNAPPSYYAVAASGGVDALTDTFTAITSSLIRTCTVPLAEAPPDPEKVNVAIDCEVVLQEDGTTWDLPDDAPDTVVFQGETCEWIETHGARRIDVVYGCMTLR
jgi:hypothetical protein